MDQAVPLAGPGSRVPWHQGPVLGGVVQVHACPQLPQPFLLSLLALGVAGRIIPRCGVRARSSVHCPSILSPALTSRDLVPKLQQLRGSWRLVPKLCLRLGRPKGEEPLHLPPVEFIQVETARGCWGPCLVLGDRAVLVLVLVLPPCQSGGHGSLGADWGGVTR